jgi:hypothetical protein
MDTPQSEIHTQLCDYVVATSFGKDLLPMAKLLIRCGTQPISQLIQTLPSVQVQD